MDEGPTWPEGAELSRREQAMRHERDTLEPAIDIAAFERMARQHRGYLEHVAVRLTGNKDAAQDLVQDTLVRALRNFDRFAPGSNERGWLVKILTRLYLDALKHAGVVNRAETDLRTLTPAEWEADLSIPDAQLWAAVSSLDPDLRTVVEQCYVQQRSYKQAADELNLPIGTIGTRLRRARERLRALLRALS